MDQGLRDPISFASGPGVTVVAGTERLPIDGLDFRVSFDCMLKSSSTNTIHSMKTSQQMKPNEANCAQGSFLLPIVLTRLFPVQHYLSFTSHHLSFLVHSEHATSQSTTIYAITIHNNHHSRAHRQVYKALGFHKLLRLLRMKCQLKPEFHQEISTTWSSSQLHLDIRNSKHDEICSI